MTKSLRCLLAGAVALALAAAAPSHAAVTCPVCKSCSYQLRVGPISIETGHMNGCGTAQVDNYAGPFIPRNQVWQNLDMEGFTDNLGHTHMTLDPAFPSHGIIQTLGPAEFPAQNDVSFHFMMNAGGMTLVSDQSAHMRATITSIPPQPGTEYTLVDSVQFYQLGDPAKQIVATLLTSTVKIGDVTAVEPEVQVGPRSVTTSPNPARGRVRVGFSVPAPMSVTVEVYDITGARVRTLPTERLSAGPHSATWDGKRDDGRPAKPGVHFVRVLGDRVVMWGRVVLAR